MCKKIKNCFDKNLTFEKFMSAHSRARKHKTYKNEVIRFEINLESNIYNLLNHIKNGTYRIGDYYSFKVYEPKERIIHALPYVDRIVHQWYVEEFVKPYIVPKFISTSFACLTDRGTHKAVDQVTKQLRIYKREREDFWILKCDIKKFFYSIDPFVLFEILKKHIADKKLLEFTRLLIFDGRESFDSNKDKIVGIPIGNYTSQFFANIYMNELDHYVKETLRIKHYTRYMDDFIILAPTKQACIDIKKQIEEFLGSYLHLELNDKSRFYPSKMGVNFCGYRIFPTHRLLRTNSKKKIKRNVKKWNKLYAQNNLNLKYCMQSLNSWLGHASHCDSYKLQQKILNSCDFLYAENLNTYGKIEKELINLIEEDMKNYNNKNTEDTYSYVMTDEELIAQSSYLYDDNIPIYTHNK